MQIMLVIQPDTSINALPNTSIGLPVNTVTKNLFNEDQFRVLKKCHGASALFSRSIMMSEALKRYLSFNRFFFF